MSADSELAVAEQHMQKSWERREKSFEDLEAALRDARRIMEKLENDYGPDYQAKVTTYHKLRRQAEAVRLKIATPQEGGERGKAE